MPAVLIFTSTGAEVTLDAAEFLRQFERIGLPVVRIPAGQPLDLARSQAATDALREGFDELVFIDSDIVFRPESVDRLRAHILPVVCGVYPRADSTGFECQFAGAGEVTFGEGGGLTEARSARLGFACVRREVFDAVREKFRIPTLNPHSSRPLVPYFAPLAVSDADGGAYLSADEAFCVRASQCGYRVMADTSVRLWRLGTYRYGWEDATGDRPRSDTFRFRTGDGTVHPPTPTVSAAPAYVKVSEMEIDGAGYDQQPAATRVRYVICSTQRSGSFLLVRQLVNAGLGVPQEYFHPLHLSALRDRWRLPSSDVPAYAAELLKRRTTPNGVWGTKLQWWQFRDNRQHLEGTILAGAKLIYLWRTNTAAQAVSLHISQATGLWGFDRTKTTTPKNPGRLRTLDGVRESERLIKAENAKWDRYFAERGLQPLRINYEEFAAEQPATVQLVADFLGVGVGGYRVPPAEPRSNDFPADVEAARSELLRQYGATKGGGIAVAGHSPTPASISLPEPPFRQPATLLTTGFPRIKAYAMTYPANMESLEQTLADFRQSDWGEEPVVFVQPADWPKGKDSASRNYKRALDHAATDGCDFALIIEDDIRVNRYLRHNLTELPIVRRDQCDYLSLFIPDLIRSPWERAERHLGYRLAKRLYSGPNEKWEKFRVWGSQAYVLSRRFVLASLERWDQLKEGQDARVLTVCSQLRLPLWYPDPCLVEHAPLRTAFGTPSTFAPDFDRDFRLQVGSGYQPPEAVPGWLTEEEGKSLWQFANGRVVLELGTASGRATVCLAQQADSVVSVSRRDQSEAAEWVRRYGRLGRVEFRRGEVTPVCLELDRRFGLAFIDTEHDAASVTRDINAALRTLEPGGVIAFHDYPDPGWPEVRRVVDDYAARLSWQRLAQVGYLGVFKT